ncbi:hypothetical protein V6N12_074747 [Hibiscus sabdariffa]|uniref:Reverse transcriptase zinc-binding domain-containing protein n=1 Tax=Hibiscus sabdariffa TaxID=183260 RepID=A0ABR1ZVL1_9ROSI
MKIGFQLVVSVDKLWVRVLRAKYNLEEVLPLSITRRNGSRLWKGICDIWDELKESVIWNIRNGRNTDFWYDTWIDSKGRLVSECNSNEVPRPVSVSTMVNGESWDWNRLQGWLPLPILEKLEACPIPKTSFGDDVPGWRWTENRCFTVGSAYEHLVTEEARNECSICGVGVEDIDHVLRRCTKAQALWLQVLGAASIGGEFFTQPFELWLMNNLFLSTSWGGSSSNWGMRFAIWCWLLWKLRCSMIFDDDFSEREDLLHRGLRLITECERVFGMTVPARVTEVRTPVRWERNGVADSLAAMGRLHGRSGVGFISPPDGVLSRLDSERTERLVEESFADLDSSRGREMGLVFDPGG